MTELLWPLVIIAIAIVIGVYFYSQYRHHARNEKEFSSTPPRHDVLAKDLAAKGTVTKDLATKDATAGAANKAKKAPLKESPQLGDVPPLYTQPRTPQSTAPQPPQRIEAADNAQAINARRAQTLSDRQPNKQRSVSSLDDKKPTTQGSVKPQTAAHPIHTKEPADSTPRTLLVLHVWAKEGQDWLGSQLIEATSQAGLTASDKKIFQYFYRSHDAPLFHVANKTEPGIFDWDKMESFTTTGLSLFMEVPTFLPSKEAFSLMYACAERLASLLDGRILDPSYRPMTQETLEQLHLLCTDLDA